MLLSHCLLVWSHRLHTPWIHVFANKPESILVISLNPETGSAKAGWVGEPSTTARPPLRTKALPTGLHERSGESRTVAPLSCSVSLVVQEELVHLTISSPQKHIETTENEVITPIEMFPPSGKTPSQGPKRTSKTLPRPERPQVRGSHAGQRVLIGKARLQGNAGCRAQSAAQGSTELENERALSGSVGP